jgi:hypothetical protein
LEQRVRIQGVVCVNQLDWALRRLLNFVCWHWNANTEERHSLCWTDVILTICWTIKRIGDSSWIGGSQKDRLPKKSYWSAVNRQSELPTKQSDDSLALPADGFDSLIVSHFAMSFAEVQRS